MKFVTNLNLNQNELQNGKFQVVASDPSTGNFEGRKQRPEDGQIF